MNNVDKIFLINLDDRPDRLNYIINHLNDIGIKTFERISATKINFDISVLSDTNFNEIAPPVPPFWLARRLMPLQELRYGTLEFS